MECRRERFESAHKRRENVITAKAREGELLAAKRLETAKIKEKLEENAAQREAEHRQVQDVRWERKSQKEARKFLQENLLRFHVKQSVVDKTCRDVDALKVKSHQTLCAKERLAEKKERGAIRSAQFQERKNLIEAQRSARLA